MRGRTAARLRPLACVAALASAGGAGLGCGEDCCTIDSLPIPVARAPLGEGNAAPGALLGRASPPPEVGGDPFLMVVDTGSPITVLSTGAGNTTIQHRGFDLLDALAGPDARRVRARFRDIGLLDLPLGSVGAQATVPLGVLGGDLLQAFSVELRFSAPCDASAVPPAGATDGCASLTLWPHFGTTSGALGDAGFAVVKFTLFGGGEVTATGDPDFLGLSGPLDLPPTRVVLRTCAVPDAFAPDGPRPSCGSRGCEVTRATGVDLSLLVATGVGPLVLAESAWTRVRTRLPAPPDETQLPRAPLLVATWPLAIAGPLDAAGNAAPPMWTTIPSLALVDAENGPNDDLGPCVDLGRSRRLEWVSYHQAHPEISGDPCVELCDTDPREPDKARNSAAYIQVGGDIPVAVIADDDPFLQGLRADVRPQGPELDGVLGAGALGQAGGGVRLELDYRSNPNRAVFSCDPGTDRAVCWAASRCPRLPDTDQQHLCFGLGPTTKPATCQATACE
jgi:hypothetical protein